MIASTAPLRSIVALARPHRLRLLLGAAAGALAIGASIGLMATSGYLISRAALRPPILALSVAIVGVRFFGISRGVLRYLDRLLSHDAVLRVMATLRARLFARLEPLAPAQLGDARTGDLLSRFVGDVEQLQELFLRVLNPVVVALAAAFLAALTATLVLPAAGLAVALCLLVAGVALPVGAGLAGRSATRREAGARATLATETVEALSAAPELVAFGAGPRAIARVVAADRELAAHRRRSALVGALAEGGMVAAAGLSAAAVLAVAIAATGRGALSGVLVAMLALLMLASFEAVRPLPAAAEQFAASSAAAARVVELTGREPDVRDPENPLPPPSGGRVELRGVRARYGAGPWVLDGLDLTVEPGEAVALVGPSGAGKTTLAHLLVRFRDPDGGAVLLDGHDLRRYAQEDVRRAIVLAGQDAHLFPTSIRQNLLIGRPEATDDELAQVVDAARLGPWVASLPDGLDTEVGEDGHRVSGGERQRLALARALLVRPRLLVLDEPDAHLDDETAAALLPDLLTAARAAGVGVLLITHRDHGVAGCDRVVRLEISRP